MSRWILSVMLVVVLFVLAACATPPVDEDGVDEGEVTATAPVPATQTEPAPATATTESYPALPTATLVVEEYPAASPPATEMPSAAYPADTRISILRPLGNQCQEEEAYEYATLEAAVVGLEEAGVEVFDSEVTSLLVCEACDCPTSEHFQAEILQSDLEEAQTLGWYQGVGEQ